MDGRGDSGAEGTRRHRTARPAPADDRARSYNVGADAGSVPGNADFAVVGDFEDAASYLAYRNHPAHRAVIEQTIQPIIAARPAIQYEL
jgi:Stress responsive A/B Barrel Domain